jgi:hypothetical protein
VVRQRCVDIQGVPPLRTMMRITAVNVETAVCASCKTTRTSNGTLTVTQTCTVKNQAHRVLLQTRGISVGMKTVDSQKAGRTGDVKTRFERKLLRTPQLRRLEHFYHARLRTFRGRQRVRTCLFSERTGSDLILKHERLWYGKRSHFLHAPRNSC